MADAATLSVLLKLQGLGDATRGLKSFSGRLKKVGEDAGAAGRSLGLMAAPILAIGAFGVRAALQFESSFTGVRKTVNATEVEFAKLSAQFRQMAKEIPISVDEINRIAEAAGQLGIKIEDIKAFTEVMAALGVTTNLTAEEAATSLARLANVMNTPTDAFDRLGSTIVDLGNNFATTEAEILTFAQRIAGAGEVAGLTEAEVLAIGAAMTSVGVQAEAGGTAVQKVLLTMKEAVATGSDELKVFGAVAGQTSTEFAKTFKEDAGAAFTSFVEGLGRSGDDAFAILEALSFTDQRLIRSFLALSGAGDLLSDSIALGTKAWEENTALTKEAALRYGTAASKFQLAKNQLNDVAITIGNDLVPALTAMLDGLAPILGDMAEFIEQHPKLTQAIVGSTAGLAALAAGLVAVGLILPGITLAIKAVVLSMAAMGAIIALLSNPAGWALLSAMIVGGTGAFVAFNDEIAAFVDALMGGTGAVTNFSGHLKDARDAARDAEKANAGLADGLKKLAPQAKEVARQFHAVLEEVEGLHPAFQSANEVVEEARPIYVAFKTSLEDMLPLIDVLTDNVIRTADAFEASQQRLVALTLSQDAMRASTDELQAAVRHFRDNGLEVLNEALLRGKITAEEFLKQYQQITAEMLQSEEAALAQAAAVLNAEAAAKAHADAMKEQLEASEKLRAEMDRLRQFGSGPPVVPGAGVGMTAMQAGAMAALGLSTAQVSQMLAPIYAALRSGNVQAMQDYIGGLSVGRRNLAKLLLGPATVERIRNEFVPDFARGGVVPGPVGQSTLIRAHGGETVTPAGRGANPTIIVKVNVDEEYIERIVRDSFRRGGLEEVFSGSEVS